jgi:hypothetical protein
MLRGPSPKPATGSQQTETHFHDTGQVNALKRKIK